MGDRVESNRRDWTTLPDLPLYLILEYLVAHSDFLRFAIVCKAWRVVAIHNNNILQRLKPCSNQLPLLMVPSLKSPHILYRIAGHEYIISSQQLSTPYNFGSTDSSYGNIRYHSCSYGWLVYVRHQKYMLVEIRLYNPFTSEKINNFPPMEEVCTVYNVKLSANPSVSRDDFYIVAIFYFRKKIALLKYGDKYWTYIDLIEGAELTFARDLLFFKGCLLYALTSRCRTSLILIDIKGSFNKKRKEAPQQLLILQSKDLTRSSTQYLVESSQGDLLVVQVSFSQVTKPKVRFEVDKVVLKGGTGFSSLSDEKGATLEEVKTLGNEALFIGRNHSMSVSVLDFPGCQADSIYFAIDDLLDAFNPGFFGAEPPKNGIYELKDGTIHELCQPLSWKNNNMMQPVWIIPTPMFQ